MAFHDLSSCRPVSMAGPGPIPWTATQAWAEANEVLYRDRFHRLIRAMDASYMAHIQNKR